MGVWLFNKLRRIPWSIEISNADAQTHLHRSVPLKRVIRLRYVAAGCVIHFLFTLDLIRINESFHFADYHFGIH